MKFLLSVILSPLYVVGFLLGFILKPVCNGFIRGLYYYENESAEIYQKKLEEFRAEKSI